ncbi:unnamed protein product [Psylliodes chrysocephalus]|uniref:Protein phosphatase 1 regulatory subunit 42 n=1 Tax=Psylliodes chrysocephalus TaxID=3402493 RepID=A0A9P0CDE0_9CUCU|nr:unnamed protein product [Psylliodes chrysocephala]
MLEIKKSESKPKDKDTKKVVNKIKKCSHLYLQEKGIQDIPKFTPSKEVSVIYLYNNAIKVVENLNGNIFPNLKCLYLHNNKIKKIDKLLFDRLRKLYIGYNQIAVIEGLEELYSLEELHVEHQTLPDGMGICFDPRCTLSLSRTLRILNISGNRIPSFSSLSFLTELQSIDASNCDIEDIKEVCDTLKNWRYLTVAFFCGNPFAKNHRYREDIIVNCYYLEVLDGKPISENSREFLKRLEVRRLSMPKHANTSINLADVIDDLPKNYPPPLQKAVSAQLLQGDKFNPLNGVHDETLNFIAWRGLPKRRPFVRKSKTRSAQNVDTAIIVNKFSYK